MSKTVTIDFDGTLTPNKSRWEGVGIIKDGPLPGAMQFIRDVVKHQELEVCIFSSRSASVAGTDAMRSWLLSHLIEEFGDAEGIKIYCELKFPHTKPPAFVALDDRTIQFNGVYPSVEALLGFKPWYKQ